MKAGTEKKITMGMCKPWNKPIMQKNKQKNEQNDPNFSCIQ